MLCKGFVGTGPLRKVDTRECISRKNEPWGSLYNDKKSEKKTAAGEVSGRCTSLTILLIVELFCV